MKQLLLICAVVALVGGCGKPVVNSLEAVPVVTATIDNPIVEKEIRAKINKPTGELTKADLEKVTELDLKQNQLTEVLKGLEKLAHLTRLGLNNNPALTKAQIDQLKKALPTCKISSDHVNHSSFAEVPEPLGQLV